MPKTINFNQNIVNTTNMTGGYIDSIVINPGDIQVSASGTSLPISVTSTRIRCTKQNGKHDFYDVELSAAFDPNQTVTFTGPVDEIIIAAQGPTEGKYKLHHDV